MADVANVDTLTETASGSVGGVTWSHNQHGPYIRNRTLPVDPNTPFQQAVRAAMSHCVIAWNSTLTQAEREGWDRYALAVRMTSPIGRRTNAGGLGIYVRSNVPRIQANEVSLPRVDVAPSLLNLPGFTPVTRVVLNFNDDTIHPFFTESDAWSTENGAAMLFWTSPEKSPAVNFYKGPYRYAGPLLGSDLTLSTPGTIPIPFPAGIGERVFVRGRLTRNDGRLSHSFRLPADPVAQVAPLPVSATFIPLGFPFADVDVLFDALIRDEPHFNLNWTTRFADAQWRTLSITTLDDTIRLRVQNIAVQPGLDIVTYLAGRPDVNGLLTGIPVAPFTIPLTL